MLTAPAVWINPADQTVAAIVANNVGISAVQAVIGSDGMPSLHQLWQSAPGGTSSVVANGVVYITDDSGNLTAYDL